MSDPQPLDVSTIEASGPRIRSLAIEVDVATPPRDAWLAWTSDESVASWWGPPATTIDLRVGGAFEILFDMDAPEGSRGSEGCRILAYVPGEMLSFTWNAPPHLSLRATNTWVVLTFDPLGPQKTRVRLVHTGFLEGDEWDAYYRYFERAWRHVLRLFVDHWQD